MVLTFGLGAVVTTLHCSKYWCCGTVKIVGVGIVRTLLSNSGKYWCAVVKMFGVGVIGDLNYKLQNQILALWLGEEFWCRYSQ